MKMRLNRGQEFVIGGYTRGTHTFDALIIGYYADDRLVYAARTRNGFSGCRSPEHRAVDPLDALARLQRARALAIAGDTARAKSVFADLLMLWKSAEAKVPIVDEARAEYARLP
jgi:hypothetical protein